MISIKPKDLLILLILLFRTTTVYAEDLTTIDTTLNSTKTNGQVVENHHYAPHIALRTNALFFAALIPNIGAELYLGKHFTVGADWFYTWFSSDNRHYYWQTYGGYVTVRKYFGGEEQCEGNLQRFCFTGHHVGVYLSGLTYDFEWGGKGYQADRFGFGAGIEYGYSKRIGRRLNLDFNIGIGFQGGEYKEYVPMDGHYVWLETRKRRWFGPTKAEISLVWLLGPARAKKGGSSQ